MRLAAILTALDGLAENAEYFTPDKARCARFTVAEVTEDAVIITSARGARVRIAKVAFLVAYQYLKDHRHTERRPCEINSHNNSAQSGPLCLAARSVNRNVRCINYIIPMLASVGVVGFSGDRPNTCWYIE